MSDGSQDPEEAHGPWRHLATVQRVLELGATDICTVSVQFGETTSVVRAENTEYSNLDGQVSVDHVLQDLRDTALMAVSAVVRARLVFPVEVVAPGLLTEPEVMAVGDLTWALMRQERDHLQQLAHDNDRGNPSQVLRVAREIGLDPEPDVNTDGQWRARCPGTHHGLLIRPGIEKFYCGYCQQGGGPADLREFARKHQEQDQ